MSRALTGGFAEYVSIPSQMPARHHESQIILGNGEKLKFLQSKLKVTSEEISLESLLIIPDFVSPPIWLQYSKQLESRSVVAQQVYIKLQTAEESQLGKSKQRFSSVHQVLLADCSLPIPPRPPL